MHSTETIRRIKGVRISTKLFRCALPAFIFESPLPKAPFTAMEFLKYL
jgi:hypothetical protein